MASLHPEAVDPGKTRLMQPLKLLVQWRRFIVGVWMPVQVPFHFLEQLKQLCGSGQLDRLLSGDMIPAGGEQGRGFRTLRFD